MLRAGGVAQAGEGPYSGMTAAEDHFRKQVEGTDEWDMEVQARRRQVVA